MFNQKYIVEYVQFKGVLRRKNGGYILKYVFFKVMDGYLKDYYGGQKDIGIFFVLVMQVVVRSVFDVYNIYLRRLFGGKKSFFFLGVNNIVLFESKIYQSVVYL